MLLACAIAPAAAHADTYVVTNLNDSGTGSLRKAIADSNGHAGADRVTFQAGLSGTIVLPDDGAEIFITDSLDIEGPGAGVLEVQGSDNGKGILTIDGPGNPSTPSITVEISGLELHGGFGTGFRGGAITNNDGDLTVREVDFRNNVGSPGGGLFNASIARVIDSTFRNNSVIPVFPLQPGMGGGLFNGGTLVVRNTTITQNGLIGDPNTSGGAIAQTGGTMTISNSTIVFNIGGNTGGIAAAGTVRMSNTILGGNSDTETSTVNHDCSGPGFISEGYNIVSRISAGCTFTSTTGDQIGTEAAPVNPGVQDFGLHGGATPSWSLNPAGLSANAGNPNTPLDGDIASGLRRCQPTDQRGMPRPQGARCDIGAFENGVTPDVDIDSGAGSFNGAMHGDTTVTFTFHETTGTAGATFECRLDSTDPADFEPCTSPKTYHGVGISPSVDHKFDVRTVDALGAPGGSESWEWTYLTPPVPPNPDTYIDSTPSGPTYDADATFEFHDNGYATHIECRLDSEPFAPCTSPKTYTNLPPGNHTFQAKGVKTTSPAAEDSTPAEFTWEILDAPRAETVIDSSPPASTTNTDATFTFSSPDAHSGFECRVDSAPFADCTSPKSYTDVDPGTHTFEVRALEPLADLPDPTPASYVWTVEGPPGTEPDPGAGPTADTDPPETTITNGPGKGSSARRKAEFEFISSEPGSTFECRRLRRKKQDKPFEPCTSPKSYGKNFEGKRIFQVRATDAAGNTDPTPASHKWRGK